MSLIKLIKAQLGLSATPANNFTLDASADNGTMKLARGNAGATTQDIMTVDAAGKVTFPQNAASSTAIVLQAAKLTSQNIAPSVDVILTNYSSVIVDTLSAFNSTTGTYTPTVAGWYLVTAHARYTVGPSANVIASGFKKNGTTVKECITKGNSAVQYFDCTALVYLNGTTDYIQVHLAQNSASTLSGGQGKLDVTYIGA